MNDWEKIPSLRTSEEGYRPVRLKILGDFALSDAEGRQFPIATKKNRALLAFLALSPGFQATRERLCGLLWSDRAEDQARSSLRQSLAVLRKELRQIEELVIKTHDDIVALRMGTLQVDAVDFLAQSNNSKINTLREAAQLYCGELLNDTSIRDASFEDWLSAERSRLRTIAIKILDRLVPLENGHSRIVAAQQLVSLDPFRESSHRLLMQAYADQGDNGLALKQFELCSKLLHDELNVAPARETLDLKRQISAGDRKSTTQENGQVETKKTALAVQQPSIAVLPFVNLSSDPEQSYFSDGLTDDIITELAKQPDLFVIARESSFVFKNTSTELSNVANKLGVRFLLQGSVRRADNRIRVNAHLINADTGGHMWADRFDRELVDIFSTQDEIVGKIVEALTGQMGSKRETRRYWPTNMEAFDLCMKGRSAWWDSMESGTHAREIFKQVIALDPDYAEAWRWLALGNCMSWLHYGGPIEPARKQSIAEAEKAVELDPYDPDARWVLSMVYLYDRRWEDAVREAELSIELNPNCADAWSNMADLKVMEGKGAEAVACAERAIIINPYPPARNFWDLGQAQFAAGQYAAAVKTLRNDAVYRTGARRILIAALAQLGRIEEARDECRFYLADNPHFTIQFWVKTQPFRDLAMRDHFVEAYRLGGLPE